jgi:hypothetical protein
LEAPFIDTKLSLNGVADDRVVLNESDNVRVAITWQNTLPVRVNDMRFSMDLSQLLLDPATIRVQDGRYDSATKTVVWNQDTNDALAFADPGDMGTVSFSFDTKPLVTTIGNDIIQNPTMALAVDVRATDTNGVIYTAEDVDTITLALNSSVTLEQETLHSSGPFASSGAMPPRANQATTYTLHWEIRNSSNALSDVRVTTTLPTGVTWLGKTSPTSEKMNYNAESRTITWNVGSIPAGGGFTTDPRGVYIQIALTPSSSEIGTVLDITRDVILTALDMFTNQTITSTRERHRTQLVGDTIENNGMVVS